MRRIGVELFLDSAQFQKGLAKSERSAEKFNRELSHMTRGAAAGSGVFKTFGRSVAFASGGFIAGHTAAEFLQESINAAREAAVAQRSLAAQMKASGESFRRNRDRVEEVARSYARFGFQNDEVIQSLTVLERGTGHLNQAIRLQGLTADIARAKNVSLSSAATVVAKVFGRQETALRRAVPGLEKNAHGWDLIAEAQRKMAGQAAAGTTASEQFAATLHDTQEIIGGALLPILNKYLGQLSTWLQRMNESGKLQANLNQSMKEAVPIVSGLAEAMGGLANAYLAYNRAASHAPGGRTGVLQTLLRGNLFEQFRMPMRLWHRLQRDLKLTGTDAAPKLAFGADQLNQFLARSALHQALTGGGGAAGGGPAAATVFSAALRNKWFDARTARELDRAQDLGLRKQLAALKAVAAEVRARLAVTKDVTRRLTLQDQLVGILRQERSVQKDISDQIRQQNQALTARADAMKSAVLDRLQQQQTSRENRRALQDAQATLNLAKQLGFAGAIRTARRGVTDARFAILSAALQAAPATLRRTGAGQTLALGNIITVNVNGSDSPEKVAREVVGILQRRSRHTTTQTRGVGAGTTAGNR